MTPMSWSRWCRHYFIAARLWHVALCILMWSQSRRHDWRQSRARHSQMIFQSLSGLLFEHAAAQECDNAQLQQDMDEACV